MGFITIFLMFCVIMGICVAIAEVTDYYERKYYKAQNLKDEIGYFDSIEECRRDFE